MRVAVGERPLYRDGEFKQEERWRVKVSNKILWSKTDSVLFLPLSERLKTVAMENIKRVRENIRVVERGGRSLKSLLQRSDPYKEHLCQDQTCAICTAGGGGQKKCVRGGCQLKSVGYIITCIECQLQGKDVRYEGETKREARIRSIEHFDGLRLKHPSNSLYKHTIEQHGGVTPEFKFQVRQVHSDPLYRQLEEGVRIENSREESLMNTKSEWVPPLLSRVALI